MRHKPRKIRILSRSVLCGALVVVSHLAAIVGAIVVVVDTLHHW
ncbi:MAG TPA: hypothetical protein VHQ92_00300 [Pseudolabrys sp.]|jgi:hypothetical protein|nr:hypothetical protein [Pseudolabrys sp.]